MVDLTDAVNSQLHMSFNEDDKENDDDNDENCEDHGGNYSRYKL